MKVLAVERILQKLDHVVAYGILRREAFCPCQDFALVQRGLLDREAESETKGKSGFGVVISGGALKRVSGVSGSYWGGGKECIDGVGEVVYTV